MKCHNTKVQSLGHTRVERLENDLAPKGEIPMPSRSIVLVTLLVLFCAPFALAGSILVVDDDDNDHYEDSLYTSLNNQGIVFASYDCNSEGGSPDSATMSAYDLVIWFTGSDSYNLYFWNGNESENTEIEGYLNQGGKLWAIGDDLLYDLYASAPDTFAAGDFVYDYMGLSSYDVQSHAGDDPGGVPQLTQTLNTISTVDTILWTSTSSGNSIDLWYVDGVSLVEGAISHYEMGPDSYIYSGLSTVQSNTTETFTVLSSFFQFVNFFTADGRDTWVSDIIEWFDLPVEELEAPDLLLPLHSESHVMGTLVGDGIDFVWTNTEATSYNLYFSHLGLYVDSITNISDTTIFVDHATLTGLMGELDFIIIDWFILAQDGNASAPTISHPLILSNQSENILVVDDDNYQNYEFSLYRSLDRSQYAYDIFDAADMGGSPDVATLSVYDLVIWYSGNDGGDLYFWDGTESDNQALKTYLDNGGMLWVNGLDLLYDRYGSAPDAFAYGDFPYDYLGLSSYDGQSRADDGGLGAPLLSQIATTTDLTNIDTLTWRFSTAYYIDAVTSNYRSFDNYVMGPDDYAFAGQTNVCHHIGDDFVVLNSFFNYNHIESDSLRDVFTTGVLDWFSHVATGNPPTASNLAFPVEDEVMELFVTDSADVEFVWDASVDIEGAVGYRFLLGGSVDDIAGIISTDQDIPGYTMNEQELYALIPSNLDTLELFWQVLSYDTDHNFTETVTNSFSIVRDPGEGPSIFSLLEPAAGALLSVHEDLTMEHAFTWERSTDDAGQAVSYTLWLMNDTNDTLLSVVTADTSLLISSTDLLTVLDGEASLPLSWSVSASNGVMETAAFEPHALTLIHGLPQEISILAVDDDNRYNNEAKLYTALSDNYYSFDTYECATEGGSPDSVTLSGYDLVIWFAGDDGVDLHFWNTDDTDNTTITQYLDNGGRIWAYGTDLLYDRYGSAPDFFGPGEMIYDYFGTGSYRAQSWSNDDNTGLPMLLPAEDTQVSSIDTILWNTTSGVLKYADGCALGEGALPDMVFGPAAYQLNGLVNSYHATDGNFITMSSWFNPYYMVSDEARAQWIGDVVSWFENTLEPETLAAPVLTAPAVGAEISLTSLEDEFLFSWNEVPSTETVVYQLVIETSVPGVRPVVINTHNLSATLYGDDLFSLTGSGSDALTLSWKVTAQTPMAAYAESAIQTHTFIEGINEAPLEFELTYPAADDTLNIENVDELFEFRWTSAVDPENDVLNYEFILVGGGTDTLMLVNTVDTSIAVSATGLIDIMEGAESIVTFWKVFARDVEFSTGSDPQILHIENHVVGVDETETPEFYALYQNYPNPFNPSTTIRYDLPEIADVRLTIFDIKGRVVEEMQFNGQSAGRYSVMWQGHTRDGVKVSTGIYLCRIQTASYSQVVKMLYLK
jgi:hypothetical protein